MTTTPKRPTMIEKYVDENGKLTVEGQILLQLMFEALTEVQATSADHEARITALEP